MNQRSEKWTKRVGPPTKEEHIALHAIAYGDEEAATDALIGLRATNGSVLLQGTLERGLRMMREYLDEVNAQNNPLGYGTCEHCGIVTDDRVWTDSQTNYEWDGLGRNPNRPKALCRECSERYTEIMNDQWEDYNSGRL